ncbi:hypothetical protein PI124_g7565 [Phytophthora idaei]|nr:hypothetical protein PI125_g17935 [Phytophthora idaei]KAG3147125.1 hypothetical protein PI126_g12986 [Phytophthora idaei]KAG3247751.1 hypothetical protein PI124_g7565 [Phytophthora idaei]
MSKVAVELTLAQLEELATEGKMGELHSVLNQCLFSDLRDYLNALGVKVRTKQYENVHSKEDHVKLLAQVLLKKEGNGVRQVADAVQACNHLKSNGEGPTEEKQSESLTVDGVGGFIVNGPLTPNRDVERVYVVSCINYTGSVLANVESRKEQVPGLKRTLARELTYYVKRLKRIQEEDGE